MVTVEVEMASIRRRNGRYQAQIRLPGKPALSKTFSYKQDAQRWARDTERRLEQGEFYVPTEAIRFQELIDRYDFDVLRCRCRFDVSSQRTAFQASSQATGRIWILIKALATDPPAPI